MSLRSKVRKIKQISHSALISPKPEDLSTLIFAITYLCDSKCTMCNIWQKYKNYPDKYREELTIEEIREIFKRSNFLKQIQIIGIAGGEPFLKKDFVDIVLFFYELNPFLKMRIPSNGQKPKLIEEKLRLIRHTLGEREIKDCDMVVGFSLDGIGDTHDRIRGAKGSYQRVLEAVELIKKIDGIKVNISFTFTPDNYKDFIAVYDLSKRLDISLSFQFAQVSSNFYDNIEKQFKWNKEQLFEIREFLIRTRFLRDESNRSLADRLLSIDRFFLEYVIEYQQSQGRSFDCFSGTHSCYIDPYGNIFPCIMLDKSYGNIREQNFDTLWKSPKAKQIRNFISQYKCHCPSPCDIPNSLSRNWQVIAWNLKNILLHGE